jgi:DNA (cytosine-5)-methyltransferase 3A
MKENEYNVLSLCDGISCGQISLILEGFNIKNYYSSEIDKYAINVTQHNFPNTIQIGDITNVKGENLPKIDIILSGTPCFTKGNFVMTINGYKPIEEIIIGDYVLTHNNRYCKVLNVGCDYKETVKLKTQGSTLITTTENHPFYCLTKNKKWDNINRRAIFEYSDFYWKNISDFNKNDKVISLKIKDEIDLPNFSDIDLYILGRFLADGCCFKTKRLNRKNSFLYRFKIAIGKHKIEDFKNKVDNRFYYTEERTVYYAHLNKKEWVELGEKFGHLAHNKFVPNFILNLPKERLKIFIEGYLDGDGYKIKENYFIFSSVSEKLILTMSLAIQKCYHGVSINFIKRKKQTIIENRIINQRDTYTSNFNYFKIKQQNFIVKEDKIGYSINNYEKTNIIEKVYNIEVEEDNSYIVNNLIVHNCKSFSNAGKREGFNGESGLFWEFVRILDEVKPKYFLFENVKMKKEWENIITDALGVKPIEINSSKFSAQDRKRIYWTNIPNVVQPLIENKLYVEDILEEEVDEKYIIDPKRSVIICDNEVSRKKIAYIGTDSQSSRIYSIHNKSVSICSGSGGLGEKTGLYALPCLTPDRLYKKQNGRRFKPPNSKFFTLTAQDKHGVLTNNFIRKLTPTECEKLQTLPTDFTKSCSSDNQRYKMIGNGWTVDVIRYILSFINKNEEYHILSQELDKNYE